MPIGIPGIIILGGGDESWPPPGPDSLPRGKTHPPHNGTKKVGASLRGGVYGGRGGSMETPQMGPDSSETENGPDLII